MDQSRADLTLDGHEFGLGMGQPFCPPTIVIIYMVRSNRVKKKKKIFKIFSYEPCTKLHFDLLSDILDFDYW